MSYFNQQQIDGFLHGIWICSRCGGFMKFTDKYEDELYCKKCGHICPIEEYGKEKPEDDGKYVEWKNPYGEDEFCDDDEEDEDDDTDKNYDGEIYIEETDELSHDD